jgi:hypothetical protein
LEWEPSRPDASGGLTINIVAILDETAGAITKAAGKSEYSGGDNKFWEDALHHMNTNLVDLPIFAGLQVSLPHMRSIVDLAAPAGWRLVAPRDATGRVRREAAPLTYGNHLVTFRKPNGYI